MKTKLPNSAWGYVILHVTTLILIKPIAYRKYSTLQLTFGKKPNISHFRTFRYSIYVLITLVQCTKMDPQRWSNINIDYESLSIIKYLKPLTGNIFTAQFADCHFEEIVFLVLWGVGKELEKEITWNTSSFSSFNSQTNQCEVKFQKVKHL